MGTVTQLRNTLAARRADRANRQQLERELASYASPTERLELEAMIDRHTPEETREVRAILARQAVTRRFTAGLRRAS
jgi:hypothetical protein